MTETKTEKTKVAEMELEVDELNSALRKLKRVTPTNPDMPILEYSIVRPAGGILISGTDFDKSTTIRLDGDIEKFESPFLLPVYKVWKILKGEKKSDKVKLQYQSDNNILTVTVNGVEYELYLMDVEDYPDFPLAQDMELVGIMDKQQLQDIFYDFTDFALSAKETTRSSLTGIHFDGEAIQATNGYYMAIENNNDIDDEFIFGAVSDIKKLRVTLKKMDCEIVEIRRHEDKIMITDPDHTIQLMATEIREEYPDYEAVVPVNNEYKVELTEQATEEMYNFCNKVSDLSSKDDPEAVKIKITEDSNKLELAHSNMDIGELHSIIEIGNKSLVDLEIAAKGTFIANILDKEDSFDLWLQDSETALLFLDTDRMYVCMPISSEVS